LQRRTKRETGGERCRESEEGRFGAKSSLTQLDRFKSTKTDTADFPGLGNGLLVRQRKTVFRDWGGERSLGPGP